jgi:hypothetical protein
MSASRPVGRWRGRHPAAMTRAHGNLEAAPALRGASGLSTQAVVQRHLSMLATGFLALPFPPEPSASTLVGPPDELRCPNDNVGVADSGGSSDAAEHPDSIEHPKRIAGLDADLGSTPDCDLGRRLTPKGSQVGQPVAQRILVRNQNHDMISQFAENPWRTRKIQRSSWPYIRLARIIFLARSFSFAPST